MTESNPYSIRKVVALPYDEAVEKTKEALKQEGFGVLSEIDMKEKLKEKLQVDYKPYVILGACNPPLAYKALQAEPEIGLLLPCNVIVREHDGRSAVSIVDPAAMLGVVDNPTLRAVADEAKARLQRVATALVEGRR